MSIKRRDFIKMAGVSSIAGVIALNDIINPDPSEAEGYATSSRALTAGRWGMVIDVSKFKSDEDFRTIIDACHKAHNVPDFGNPKDEIKWIWTESFEHAFPGQEDEYLAEKIKHQSFPVLCNHCAKPACVRVCPTQATFKRKSDGVVLMDYHRCIGCRFCMAACPYGARSFNWRDPRPFIREWNLEFPSRTKGVVEKCNFCAERLAMGKMPACVEAAPEGGMVFGDLEDPKSEIRHILGSKYTVRRKPEVGTHPSIYYVIGGGDHA